MPKINLKEKLALFDEHWTPKILAEVNNDYVKVAKGIGEIAWHSHENEDEMFLVLHGQLNIRLRDEEIQLKPGEFYVVPRGVEHAPYAEVETHIMLIEPKETKHTGETVVESTVPIEQQEWI